MNRRVLLVMVLVATLALASCGASQGAGTSASQPDRQDATGMVEQEAGEQEARAGEATVSIGDDGKVVAKSGEATAIAGGSEGAVARSGDAEARAGEAGDGEPEAREPEAGEPKSGDGASRSERPANPGSRGAASGKAVLRVEGDPGTEFSGTCVVGDKEYDIGGQVPERLSYELDGKKLECGIQNSGSGSLQVSFTSGGSNIVQQSVGGQSDIRIVYDGGGSSSVSVNSVSSSASNSSSSSR